MESIAWLGFIIMTYMYFRERTESISLKSQLRAMIKRSDLDKATAAMEPLKDYVPNPVPDYMYDYVEPNDRAVTDPAGLSSGTTVGAKKHH